LPKFDGQPLFRPAHEIILVGIGDLLSWCCHGLKIKNSKQLIISRLEFFERTLSQYKTL
jgi:hypothetical protein